MNRSLITFIKNYHVSLPLVALIVAGVLLTRCYSEKRLNDGIIYNHGSNCAYISGVSRREAKLLDSTMDRLYGNFVEIGELSSGLGVGYYSINFNSDTARLETSARILHEIIDSSGLKIDSKQGL